MGRNVEATLGVLNGLLGDYLARTGNGLAIGMQLVHRGEPLPVERRHLARAHPHATPRLALLVHGLMGTETDWELEDGGDYGTLLARDLGFTALHLRYNSGLAIPDSGAALAGLLDRLEREYPVPIREIVLIGHSMGGLVIRAACHTAREQGGGWLRHVRRAIYLGTPHLGSPLERAGRVVAKVLNAVPDPYARLAADLANLRSAGIRDLGDGDLRHEDRARGHAGIGLRDPRHPVPLLPEIEHYLVAGSLSATPWLALLFGDSMVTVQSATFGHCKDAATLALPPSHVKVLPGVGHVSLARHPSVYPLLRGWCGEES